MFPFSQPSDTNDSEESCHDNDNIKENANEWISTFHHCVGQLFDLLAEIELGESQIGTSTTKYHHNTIEMRQCLRNIQELLSQQEIITFIFDGDDGATRENDMEESTPRKDYYSAKNDESRRLHLQQKTLLQDLLSLMTLDNTNYDNVSLENLVSCVLSTTASCLIESSSFIHLNNDQIARLLAQALQMIQQLDHVDYSSANDSNFDVLHNILTLINEQSTVENLLEIIPTEEAIPALQISLEVACHASQASSLPSPSQSRVDKSKIVLPPDLFMSLRVFIDSLMETIMEMILHEQRPTNVSPDAPLISLSEYLLIHIRNVEIQNDAGSNQSKLLAEVHDKEHVLALLKQYGLDMLEVTLEQLRQKEGKEIDSTNVELETLHHDSQSLTQNISSENLSQDDPGIGKRNKVATALRLALLSTNFLLVFETESTLTSSNIFSGLARSLWRNFSHYVLTDPNFDEMNEYEAFQETATYILHRLTKSHVNVRNSRNSNGSSNALSSLRSSQLSQDEFDILVNTIFRLLDPNEQYWTPKNKEWIESLLNEHPDKDKIRMVVLSATLLLSHSPEITGAEAIQHSILPSLFQKTELNEEQDEDAYLDSDPWTEYIREQIENTFSGMTD